MAAVTVFCSRAIVAVGLKATRKIMFSPLLIPPCPPPERFVAVRTLPSRISKESLCSEPFIAAAAKPEPISKPFVAGRLSIVADWFSGKNFWGYFTPGISVTLPRSGLLNIGYSIGNDSFDDPGNHNRALFVYYGITFP